MMQAMGASTVFPRGLTRSSPRAVAGVTVPLDAALDPGLFKVLGEPTRARLMACLLKCGRGCSATEVAACCSLDFSTVTRHLATLARAGWLSAEKRGRTVWYSADASAIAGRFRALADAVESACDDVCCGEGCCGVDGGDGGR